MAARRFEAELGPLGREGLVEIPFDVRDAFGQARPPVRGTINGHPFRTTVAVYGGQSYLGFRKEVREAAGVEPGDTVTIELERDDAPREVEVPAPLAEALAGDEAAAAAFEGLSYTHQREFAEWIVEAKKEETRERRVTQALQMLREGKTR